MTLDKRLKKLIFLLFKSFCFWCPVAISEKTYYSLAMHKAEPYGISVILAKKSVIVFWYFILKSKCNFIYMFLTYI
jgi:hypothetical protein